MQSESQNCSARRARPNPQDPNCLEHGRWLGPADGALQECPVGATAPSAMNPESRLNTPSRTKSLS
jgi:hypothetical protein